MCVRPIGLKQHTLKGLHVPCGQCIECRLKRSREWAIRCMHEGSLHEENWFLTLTYADEYLPKDWSLDRRAFPLFMKRVRKAFGKVRYFHAGEYGERNQRPHYHALLFGLRLSDARKSGKSQSGHPVFTSEALSDLWERGFVQLGSLTFESAEYVARYCVEKFRSSFMGVDTTPASGWVDYYTGEFRPRTPEYATMSRRPGIGAGWYEKFREEVYRDDSVMVRGAQVGPPRYYDKLEAARSEAAMEVVKARRVRKHGARCTIENGYTWRTNAAREVIAVAKLRQLQEARV